MADRPLVSDGPRLRPAAGRTLVLILTAAALAATAARGPAQEPASPKAAAPAKFDPATAPPAAAEAAPEPGATKVEEVPIERRPYAIRAWVAVAPGARLDARGRAQLVARWSELVRRFVGSPWELEIAEGPGPLATSDLEGLTAEALAPLVEARDQAWAIRIEPADQGFVMTGRPFDARTGRLGPTQRREAPYPADAARALLDLALDLFTPVAEYVGSEAGGATIVVQGGALPPAHPIGRVVQVGTVFQPLRIVVKPDGARTILPIPLSYLRVESLDGARARCAIVSQFASPLTARVANCNRIVFLRVRAAAGPTRLRFTTADPDPRPLAGYAVTVRPLPEGDPRDVGMTDRDGRVVIRPRDAAGLVALRLVAAGVEPLIEFPLMPGTLDEELTLKVDPRAPTVALEARLDALRDRIVDQVALRLRLQARLQDKARLEAWDEVDALLQDYRRLPPRATFEEQLSDLKQQAEQAQEQTRRAVLTATAQMRIADTEALIARYLDEEAFRAFEVTLREARGGPPEPEPATAPAAGPAPLRKLPAPSSAAAPSQAAPAPAKAAPRPATPSPGGAAMPF